MTIWVTVRPSARGGSLRCVGATAVTPSGVCDGDPAALAGLCDRRGPAVLAYCRHVAGESAAAPAAAEAFAHFRAAVVAADDATSLNPEALLVNATRHAAARHATIVATGLCAEVPALLAARADRSITLANHEFLQGHLGMCWTCRAPVARFEAAERAYRDPGDTVLAEQDIALIVAAMTAAAPVRSQEPPPIEVPPLTAAAMNGSGHLDAEELAPVQGIDQPTTEHRPLEGAEQPPAPAEAPSPEPALSRRPRRSGGALAAGSQLPLPPRGSSKVKKTSRPQRGSAKPVKTSRPKRAQATAVSLPRPQRGTPVPASLPRAGRSPVRASLVLPIVLVACALVIALFVAGVFGAGDPVSSPGSSAPPPPPPAATRTPEVVVVPGADEATAADVELAKERARAKRRREGAADRASSTPAAPPPPAANAAPAPPPAATDAPASDRAGSAPAPSEETGIDADNGATGAEQLPPAQDTSTVPELAPPPEVAAPPG